MAHISSIGAGIYSDLSVASAALPSTPGTASSWLSKFVIADNVATSSDGPLADAKWVRIPNVREFPSMGSPPNIVNVPIYGQPMSQQVQGQADAPSLELTINFVPAEWADGTVLRSLVGNGKSYMFRFALLNARPTAYGSEAAGLGTVQNSQYFWIGKVEALLINPQLTDANTATLTLSQQSDFYGAFSNDAT
jgi:hypothetical protein